MKRHLFALLTGALLLSGCAALQPSTSVHTVAASQPTFIDMDASRRGVIIIPKPDGRTQFCAEPSPDVALETVTRILAEAKTNGNANIDAKAEAEFRTAVVQLSRTAVSIRFLRESLYRVCEQSVNQNLSADQVEKLTALAIATAMKLAEADVTKNQADLAKELSDPKVREVWQQVFGAPPTVAPSKKPTTFQKGKTMKLRRAISALGMAFALSFGLMLAPSQADAATLTINPRANAVEAGQVLAAPDGSVFTITIYDAGLAVGQKSVTHTFQTGDTLRQTANKIVQAINADTELQAIGVTATLQNGANYTIASTSTNGTVYKQTTTGGGSNRLAIQQTLTIGGTVTVDDKLTLTIYDAGLVGGKEAVVYRPNTGDTIADIVVRLRNKINNSTTLAALGITAKVSSVDPNVLLIESPTFDATEKFTSYSAKVSAGATETVALGAFWGTNGAQSISVAGPITVGETVKFSIFNVDLPDSAKDVTYVVQAGDTLNKIACGLRTEVNNDSDLAEIGAHARCGAAAGGPGMLSLASQATSALTVWKTMTICKPVVISPTKWPGANQVKRCGSASPANAQVIRSTLEALGDQTDFPGGYQVEDAASKLSGSSQLTWYLFADHDAYYYSGYIPIWRETGGPLQASVDLTTPLANDGTLGLILGYSVGSAGSGYSAIFESTKDQYTVGSGIQNYYIDHSTAHESGHHIDTWGGGKISDSAAFQTAWQRDMAYMAVSPICDFEGPVENSTSMDRHSGVFSGAIDRKGNIICDAGNGSGGSGTESSTYSGDSIAVMNAAYPYFDQQPPREVFPELFADLAGFDDTYTPNSNVSGSASIQTSNALACTSQVVYYQSRYGRNPTAQEMHTAGYYKPNGTNTDFLACDGSTTTTPNSGA